MIDFPVVSRSLTRIVPIAAACLAVLSLLVGCGGDSQSGAKDVAQQYVDARNSGDTTKVCDLYTDTLKQRLGADKCAEFIQEQTSGAQLTFRLTGVQENGDKATATLAVSSGTQELPQSGNQLQLNLTKQDGDWKIDGFGVGGSAPSS